MDDSLTLKKIELAMAKLDKQYGKNSILHGDYVPEPVPVIATGNFKLDLALGVGGLPRGRITEIFGPEALGKSALSLGAIAECQQAGGRALYVDAECDLDGAWATHLGVNMDTLYYAQPESGEEGLQIVEDMIDTGGFDLVIFDSVAAMVPQAELDGSMEDQQIGLQARLLSKGLRKLRHTVKENNVALVFVNQVRDKIGFMQSGTTSPGGRALKFYSSVRIELKRMGDAKNSSQEVIGTRVKAHVLKNKVAPPHKIVEYDLLDGIGFNNFGSIIEMGEKYGIFTKKGAYYYMKGEEKAFAQGLAAASAYLASDLDLTRGLKQQIKDAYVGKA